MSVLTVQQMAERVAGLMEERLGIRGRGLGEKLRRARGRMPKRIQAEAAVLARAAETAGSPRLMQRLDHQRLAEAYDSCLQHLNGLGRWQRRKSLAINLAGSIAFRILVVAGLLAAVLVWRGYL